MTFSLKHLDSGSLANLAAYYEEHGYCLINDLEEMATAPFRRVVAESLDVPEDQLDGYLDPTMRATLLPLEARRKVSRVETPKWLAQALLGALEPVLTRLIGPFVQVSRDFHAQFKGGAFEPVNYGGYGSQSDYMEVHRPYMLHQDFTGASLPTSPSAVTLWTGLNSCPDWTVRFYPRSHRQGLLCSSFIPLDDARLQALGEPIDVRSTPGSAILFNALMLHGTSNPGPGRRVSCDIRFFPLCPFLPSEAYVLGAKPLGALRAGLDTTPGPVLRAPLQEARLFLGEDVREAGPPLLSPLNWVNYLSHVLRGELNEALPWLERLTNSDLGTDPASVYASRYHGRPMHEAALRSVREGLARLEPGAPELAGISRRLNHLPGLNGRAATVGTP